MNTSLLAPVSSLVRFLSYLFPSIVIHSLLFVHSFVTVRSFIHLFVTQFIQFVTVLCCLSSSGGLCCSITLSQCCAVWWWAEGYAMGCAEAVYMSAVLGGLYRGCAVDIWYRHFPVDI